RGCLNRQLARPFAVKDAVNVRGRASKWLNAVIAVGQQSAILSKEAIRIHNGHAMLSRRPDDHLSMTACEAISHDHDAAMWDFAVTGNDRFEERITSGRHLTNSFAACSIEANSGPAQCMVIEKLTLSVEANSLSLSQNTDTYCCASASFSR